MIMVSNINKDLTLTLSYAGFGIAIRTFSTSDDEHNRTNIEFEYPITQDNANATTENVVSGDTQNRITSDGLEPSIVSKPSTSGNTDDGDVSNVASEPRDVDFNQFDSDEQRTPDDMVEIIDENSNSDSFEDEYFNLKLSSEIFTGSKELQWQADEVFKEQSIVRSKLVVPDSDYNHFKAKLNREQLAKDTSLYVKHQSRKDLQKYYISILYNNFKHLYPISESHIAEISKAVLNKDSNLSLPMMNINLDARNVTGKTVYGTALGLYDLVYFVATRYNCMVFNMVFHGKLDTSNGAQHGLKTSVKYSQSINPEPDFKPIEIVSHLKHWPYKPFKMDGFSQYSSERSIFDKASITTVIKSLYSITLTVDVSFAIDGESERRAIIISSKNHEQYADGFKVRDIIPDILTWDVFSPHLLNVICGLFIMPESMQPGRDNNSTMKQYEDVVSYVSTIMKEELLSSIRSSSKQVQITHIDYNLEVIRHANDAKVLNELYKELINQMMVVPLSPLHYLLYLENLDVKFMDYWKEFAFYSAVACSVINPILTSVMPKMDITSKNQFSLYLRNDARFESNYYNSEFILPWQKHLKFSMTKTAFFKEMYVKTMLYGDLPNYFCFITESEWEGNQSSSIPVHPASLHNIFSKFGLGEPLSNIDKVTSELLLDTPEYKRPYYVKSMTRLTRDMPSIYGRFLEVYKIEVGYEE
jgi:hypothetical protein